MKVNHHGVILLVIILCVNTVLLGSYDIIGFLKMPEETKDNVVELNEKARISRNGNYENTGFNGIIPGNAVPGREHSSWEFINHFSGCYYSRTFFPGAETSRAPPAEA